MNYGHQKFETNDKYMKGGRILTDIFSLEDNDEDDAPPSVIGVFDFSLDETLSSILSLPLSGPFGSISKTGDGAILKRFRSYTLCSLRRHFE